MVGTSASWEQREDAAVDLVDDVNGYEHFR